MPRIPEPDQRRGELVRAAFQLIAEKGLEGLRTRDIAKRVGINIATLHYHFKTKEALLAAVVAFVTQMFRAFHAPARPNAKGRDQLAQLLAGQAGRRRAESKVDAVLQELMLRARRDPVVKKAFAALLKTWNATVADIVRRCIREKSLPRSTRPQVVAAIVTSFLFGASVQRGITPSFAIRGVAGSLATALAPAPKRAKKR